MATEGYYQFEKVASFAKEKDKYARVWTDEIDNGIRHIYLRCIGCKAIIKLGNREGTRSSLITITPSGVISPCVICPHCEAHLWTTLVGYEKVKDARDIFD